MEVTNADANAWADCPEAFVTAALVELLLNSPELFVLILSSNDRWLCACRGQLQRCK